MIRGRDVYFRITFLMSVPYSVLVQFFFNYFSRALLNFINKGF